MLQSCYKAQISDLQSQINELKFVQVAGVQSSIELMEKMDEQTKAKMPSGMAETGSRKAGPS